MTVADRRDPSTNGHDTAEATFRAVLDAAPDAIICVDGGGRIVLVNAQAEHLFGYVRAELIGQALELLVPERMRAVHAVRREEFVSNGRHRTMEHSVVLAGRRKDGTEFPAEISLSSLDTPDGLLVTAAVRDATERIKMHAEHERLRAQADRERFENRLHQVERLESLGQLAGGVAHDFNNLLAVILNYVAFIDEEVTTAAATDDRWAAVSADVREVQRAAERAIVLTRQLLAFGRREIVEPRVLGLNQVVSGVEQLLRRTVGEHVELVTTLAPELWSVVADAGQLEQVLLNLAVNARDAMPAGGTLTIDTANVTVDDDDVSLPPGLTPGRYARLRVGDTGEGMGRDVLSRAFEPFFTTKPKGEGTGLGLASAYGMVAQAGGDARLASEPGVGTTFTALLPATDAPRAADLPSHHHAGDDAPRTVLVVEDEDAMRKVAQRILVRNGHDVLLAASGSEALVLAGQHPGPIDLLLTDVVMPQMLGKEVAERIAGVRPEIRVLYMSGYALPVLASNGSLDEGVALLKKPFDETSLLTKLREVLDG